MKKQKANNTRVLIFVLTAVNAIFAIYSVSALAHDEHLDQWFQEEVRAHEADLLEQEAAITKEDMYEDDFELLPDSFIHDMKGCTKASTSQLNTVNSGNSKRQEFQAACSQSTADSSWCAQIERPNPSSKSIFSCTYGAAQPHLLIHPTTTTWNHAIKAIQQIKLLTAKGICVSQIYNWWRPEPYNANVGGAAGRHPFGTSVDVRFCTNSDATRAFDELCKARKAGVIRALGYYGSTGVHIGVGDSAANTWGRTCK